MNRTFHALLLALFLTAIGLTIFFHKLTTSDVPLLPNQAYRSWYVEAKLSLDSESPLLASETGLPTQLEFHLPQASERYEIVKIFSIGDSLARSKLSLIQQTEWLSSQKRMMMVANFYFIEP
ncbi:hypothetical protein PCC6912_63420 [Chlorogloeopsis fritschii PCC 6912]|uniref:Inactive transglutaminase fused to 7 transmembrane helices domain-containing protein n=1 Tax=Chlorogloeopsis fritschii PCC 6912 TaxID=211165 RepID=A0A433MWJ8_CHLFR|nr:UUP1 family membrane protein [Chlorogloeopsis fritschii]RUR72364.1 hypothetical protein PCC6912_63420 [Chlorogloeopsis fritschii PCC 6912]